MFGLGDFATRFNTAIVTSPVALLAWNHDWNKTMEDLATRIVDANARRANLVSQRDAAIVASVSGDAKATKRADELDSIIAASDREIERLSTAHKHASERVSVEEAAKAENKKQAHIAEVRKRAKALHNAAVAADRARATLGAALKELDAAWQQLLPAVRHPDLRQSYAYFWLLAPGIISSGLTEVSRNFKRSLIAPEKLSFAANAVDADHAATLAEKAYR